MLHTLPDGTRLVLRPIEAADKARLAVAHGRLSEETIRRRYLAAKPRVTSSELTYLTEVDGHNHIALAAFPADDPETLAGIARCVAPAGDDAARDRGIRGRRRRRVPGPRARHAARPRAGDGGAGRGHPPLRRHDAQRQ